MLRDDATRLRQAADAARKVGRFVAGRARRDLDDDELLEAGLIRTIEVVGEALSQVSPQTRSLHQEIPWRDAIGMRNRLVHGYDSVDLDVVWRTATEEVPALLLAIDRILAKE